MHTYVAIPKQILHVYTYVYICPGSQKTIQSLVVFERTIHTPPRLINSTLGI